MLGSTGCSIAGSIAGPISALTNLRTEAEAEEEAEAEVWVCAALLAHSDDGATRAAAAAAISAGLWRSGRDDRPATSACYGLCRLSKTVYELSMEGRRGEEEGEKKLRVADEEEEVEEEEEAGLLPPAVATQAALWHVQATFPSRHAVKALVEDFALCSAGLNGETGAGCNGKGSELAVGNEGVMQQPLPGSACCCSKCAQKVLPCCPAPTSCLVVRGWVQNCSCPAQPLR